MVGETGVSTAEADATAILSCRESDSWCSGLKDVCAVGETGVSTAEADATAILSCRESDSWCLGLKDVRAVGETGVSTAEAGATAILSSRHSGITDEIGGVEKKGSLVSDVEKETCGGQHAAGLW